MVYKECGKLGEKHILFFPGYIISLMYLQARGIKEIIRNKMIQKGICMLWKVHCCSYGLS